MTVRVVDRYLLAGLIGTPLLLLAVGAALRTELVIGERVREAVEARARAAGADVEIVTVVPAGLWGIELVGVSARVPRGQFAVELDLEAVEVQPSLAALLRGELVIDELELRGGTLGLRPWVSAPKAPARSAAPTTSPPRVSEPGPTSPSASPAALTRFDVALRDVDVVMFSDRYRTRPMHLERLELDVSTSDGVLESAGFGKLPDGTAFRVAGPTAGRIVIDPVKRTHIERWAAPLSGGAAWPIAISATRLEVCASRRGCDALLRLQDVEIMAPVWRDDVRVTAPYATVARAGNTLVLDAPEMSIVDPSTREFAARLTEIDVRYALDTGDLSGALELADREAGTLGVDWTFDAEDFDASFAARGFDIASVWHLVPYGGALRPHRVEGEARTRYDLTHLTLDVRADLRFDRISAWFSVTRESFDASDVRLLVDAYADLRGRALSLRDLQVGLGEARPFTVRGSLIHARRGWSFDARLALAIQDVNTLRAELPPQLAAVTEGAILAGDLGFELAARGHTAFPESLVLAGAVHSTVEVVEDAPATDPHALGKRGAPPQLEAAGWTAWPKLPLHAVDVVLAAEDAQFWNHHGFDWGGLERAMKFNIGRGRLARGGSTISQQVAKNLWLSGERTIARKLQEAYLTWRLEAVHTKRRIIEIYLNLASWGPGTRGIRAASKRYFGAEPAELATVEVALLAAILPNPARFGAWIEQGKLATSRLEKVEHTLRNLRFMKKIDAAEYDRAWQLARDQGRIGRLTLVLCDDDGSAGAGVETCAPE